MTRIGIIVRAADGHEHAISDAAIGQSLMEVAREHDVLGVLDECGGACSCATCHVYIDPAWSQLVGPPDAMEDEILDMVEYVRQKNSRLSCQIVLGTEHAGLKVEVAPDL